MGKHKQGTSLLLQRKEVGCASPGAGKSQASGRG